MSKFKNIRIPKRGGGSRLQRVQVLKSGKYKFVKNPKTSRVRSNPKPKTKTKRSVRKTTKKKGRRRRNFKIPLATVAGLVGTLSVKGASNQSILEAAMTGDLGKVGYQMREKLAGVDANGKFQWQWLIEGWTPLIVGCLVSKFIGGWPLNLNQRLRQIPFIKI